MEKWKSKLKFGKLLLIFSIPIVVALWLYPLPARVIFDGNKYQQHDFIIEDIFKKEPTFTNLIADVFSVPLFLDWYEISIINNEKEIEPTCLEGNPPMIFFTFIDGDPRTYQTNLKETTLETGGYSNSGPGHPTYYVSGGEKSYFVAPSWEKFSINGGFALSGYCSFSKPFLNNDDFNVNTPSFDYYISIKPYWVSWIVRLCILFIFWFFLLSSAVALFDWVKGSK